MRQGASFVAPSFSKSFHIGTKGCLFDFTSDLSEARYKALQSFVCSTCRARMQESGAVRLANDLERVLDMKWLGKPKDPYCPAGIVGKLGYDLFLTKGIKPTLWENVRSIIRDEGTKEIVKLVAALLLAILLLRLGRVLFYGGYEQTSIGSTSGKGTSCARGNHPPSRRSLRFQSQS